MSDGYRAAVAMIVDIVRKLIDVYGLRGFASTDGGEARVEYDGVVMVDEIDAHLHPSRQRLIGEWFKRIMPNIQFIVTSHSPLICQAADEKGIFRLPAPGSGEAPVQLSDNDYEKIVAGRPNEIFLGPAFEMKYSRSPRAVRARTQYANLQARKSARALIRAEAVHEKQISLYITDEEDHAPD